jgi:hypothetical protein
VILAREDDEGVRGWVAENPTTPAEILAILARDDDGRVRSQVAVNPSTLLEDLAPRRSQSPSRASAP